MDEATPIATGSTWEDITQRVLESLKKITSH